MIRIKPHHFVDILTGYGDGKPSLEPHPYGHALHEITRAILDEPETVLELEIGADDICTPCVHNLKGVCDDVIDTSFRPEAPSGKREWNLIIDRRWIERLGVGQGDRIQARELAAVIRDRMGVIERIYREIPKEMTVEREAKLRAGITHFLAIGSKKAAPASGSGG